MAAGTAPSASQFEDRSQLRAYAENVALAMNQWSMVPGKGHPNRQQVQIRRQKLAGLRHAAATAQFFEPVLRYIASLCGRIGEQGRSWAETLKPLSANGYDINRNNLIDYGNRQYRGVLFLWDMHDGRVSEYLQHASVVFSALDMRLPDTEGTLDKQGDVVEICMALCRGHFEYGKREYAEQSKEAWRQMYSTLCALCKSMDQLFCYLSSSSPKIDPFARPVQAQLQGVDLRHLRHIVRHHSYVLAVVAANLQIER